MRRTLFILALALTAAPLFAREGHHRNVSLDGDRGPLTSCDQLNVSFDDQRATVVAEEITAASGLRSLRIDARSNGGISAVGWDENRYAVTACKATAIGGDPNSLRVELKGNEITSAGDSGDDSLVYFIVRAPRSANLELVTSNGPLSVSDIGGSIAARTKNGPISLKNVDGSIDANAVNGPISFAGERGTVKLHAENGPISVKLSGRSWEGGSFDATTSNGPLTLKLPRDYASGVVVESDGHGPVSCKADACRNAVNTAALGGRRPSTDDDGVVGPRHLEFGTGAAALHLATSNGPVSIKDLE